MSKTHSKQKINRIINQQIELREQIIINTLFDEFIKCLKPKPKWFPQKLWTYLITKYVFDLGRLPKLKENRSDSIKNETIARIIPDGPVVIDKEP